jgi:hypothetical protein
VGALFTAQFQAFSAGPETTMPACAGIVFGFDLASATRIALAEIQAYFFLDAFFLAFFLPFAMLALQLSG